MIRKAFLFVLSVGTLLWLGLWAASYGQSTSHLAVRGLSAGIVPFRLLAYPLRRVDPSRVHVDENRIQLLTRSAAHPSRHEDHLLVLVPGRLLYMVTYRSYSDEAMVRPDHVFSLLGFEWRTVYDPASGPLRMSLVRTGMTLPLWMPTMLFGIVPVTAYARRRWKRRRRRRLGLCVECGHDLRGNTTGICPGCGRPTSATESVV